MKKTTLSEICEMHSGGTPSTKYPEYWGGNIPWLSSSESGKRFIYSSNTTITELGIKNSATKLAKKGSILIATAGEGKTRGQVSYLEIDAYINQSLIAINSIDKNVNNLFLYYYLRNSYQRLRNMSDVTGIRGSLSGDLLKTFLIEYPSIEEQIEISKLLRDIDSKIENNYLMINEINSTIKEIYDQWFIQFDFNSAGKPYKANDGAMVFNDEIKRSIPEGWVVKKFKELFESVNTGLNPRKHFVLNDGDIKYITVKNLTTDGTLNYEGCDTISQKTKELIHKRSCVEKGDILFASIAPLGRAYFVKESPADWEINESVFSIRPNKQLVTSEFLYCFLTSNLFIKTAENSSEGSIFSGIRISTLENMDVVIPPKEIINNFTYAIAKLFEKQFFLEKEINELDKTMNKLLPLLMNGQAKINCK